MDNEKTILLGAVAYDLFSNYERQIEELLKGHIDVAWNTPLAHVQVRQRTGDASLSLGMRDSDRDFRAKVIVRRDSRIKSLKDLQGKTLAVGSSDSTQARILPLYFIANEGIDLNLVKLLPFDTDLGKHGDTGTSEIDVLKALHEGQVEFARGVVFQVRAGQVCTAPETRA